MPKEPAVYILSNRKNGTLYVGVTSHLVQRVYQHKHGLVDGFSKKYHIHKLVYYEVHASIESAIMKEKQLKRWERKWKIRIIDKFNPEWADLYSELL